MNLRQTSQHSSAYHFSDSRMENGETPPTDVDRKPVLLLILCMLSVSSAVATTVRYGWAALRSVNADISDLVECQYLPNVSTLANDSRASPHKCLGQDHISPCVRVMVNVTGKGVDTQGALLRLYYHEFFIQGLKLLNVVTWEDNNLGIHISVWPADWLGDLVKGKVPYSTANQLIISCSDIHCGPKWKRLMHKNNNSYVWDLPIEKFVQKNRRFPCYVDKTRPNNAFIHLEDERDGTMSFMNRADCYFVLVIPPLVHVTVLVSILFCFFKGYLAAAPVQKPVVGDHFMQIANSYYVRKNKVNSSDCSTKQV